MTHVWSGVLPIHREIVIVESDVIVRELMVEILQGIRAEIVTFGTATEALDYILDSHGACSLLITDHGPGRLSGLALSEMFRAKWPYLPVILTCACGLEFKALPQETVYLQKPWPIDALCSTVKRIFTQQ